MMTPAGVQTPSTTRANRLRQPLESPFPPSSPSVATDAGATSSHAHGLSDRQLREITTVFQIFDPTLSGYIDEPTFEVMVRSLGFRLSQVEIVGMVELLWEERQQQVLQQQEQADDATTNHNANERRRIDLSTAVQILSQKGYANRNEDDEMHIYFRIFDGGNKGYITLEDLQRVQKEADEAGKEMNIGSTGSSSGMDNGAVGDDTLKAMIEQFDHNRDGVIDYEEFKNILEPVLS
ncbi:hypothetical protein ACHAXR_010295 [Thalassiosira sp. AJA248-18]